MPDRAPLRTTVEVLGIPVAFSSNVPEVLGLARSAFEAGGRADGGRRSPRGAAGAANEAAGRPASGGAANVAAQVTILVEPGDRSAAAPAKLVHRTVGRRVLYGPGPVTAIADPDRGEAIAHVAASMLDDPTRLRREVIEALTLSLIGHLDRQPLHAAAVTQGGAALLLCAPGGTGKSTLTYAAAREGLGVLAEDTVYVQCLPSLAIWGLPRPVHLPPEVASFFPELGALEPRLMPGGETKLVVDLRGGGARALLPGLGAAAMSPVRRCAGLCLLDRNGAPGRRRLPSVEAEEALCGSLEPGFDVFGETIREPIRLIAAAGCWRLSLPPRPSNAVAWLRAILKAADPAGR